MINKQLLIKWEDELDIINGDYGNKKEYCIFCKSIEYDSQQGIIHQDNCIITELRKIIKTNGNKNKL